MTEQPAHGMTMASRGQAAHRPDHHVSPADELVRMAEEDGLYAQPAHPAPVTIAGIVRDGTQTPHLSMTERIRVAEFEAAPEPDEIVVERVAQAMYEELLPVDEPWNVTWGDEGEFTKNRYRRMATAAIAAMEETR